MTQFQIFRTFAVDSTIDVFEASNSGDFPRMQPGGGGATASGVRIRPYLLVLGGLAGGAAASFRSCAAFSRSETAWALI